MRVEHDAQRLQVEARQADGERRVVGERGLDADHDRLMRRAQDLHARVGDLAGDAQARRRAGRRRRSRPPSRRASASRPGAPRSRAGYGRRWSRRACGPPTPVTTSIPAARSRAWPCPADLGIGVLHRGDDARDARRDDGVGAGRRPAEMRAGLERHIERRAARRLARLAERDDLGVRPAARRRDAAPDDDAVLHENRADRRVRRGEAERALAEVERRLHPAAVVVARPPTAAPPS